MLNAQMKGEPVNSFKYIIAF